MAGDRAKAFSEQAQACLRSGRFEDAVEFARQAVELQPSPSAFALLGAALSQSEKPDEANDAFEQAAKLEPKSAKHQYNLAANCYRFGWKAQAARFAKTALTIDPNHAKARALSERLEKENQVVKTVYNPDLTRTTGPEAPPVITPGGTAVQSPVWAYQPPIIQFKHSIQWVEKMGNGWDGLLWGTYALQTILFIALYTMRFETFDSQGTSAFLDFGSGGGMAGISLLLWMILTLLWIVDLVDRRPSGNYLVAAIFGMFLTLPFLMSCMAPIFGVFLFPIYMIGTRARRN